MSVFPLVKHLRSTTISNAFILNAIVAAMIATLSIELREELNNDKGQIYDFFSQFFPGKGLTSIEILSIVFFASFFIAFTAYHIMYFVFDYGPGMLSPSITKIKYY
jgi:hypothetical protein